MTTAPRGMPCDLFGRYATLRDLVERHRMRTPLRILEVGGAGSPLRQFLPEDTITVLDQTATSERGDVQGDARAVPFADASFDVVLSTDMLEHISAADRPCVLDEQCRVAREFTVIAAPFNAPGTERCEQTLDGLYTSLSGHPHRWLAEHRARGLPSEAWIEDLFRARNLRWAKTHHGLLALWPLTTTLAFLAEVSSDQGAHETYRQFCDQYAAQWSALDHAAPAYRTAYVVSGDPRRRLSSLPEPAEFPFAEYLSAATTTLAEMLARASTASRAVHRRLEQTLHEERSQLADVTASWSWRTTSPLRVLKRQLRAASRRLCHGRA